MAFHTVVNSQITDAVTQSNVKVIGEAPAVVAGAIAQAAGQAARTVEENGTATQQALDEAPLDAGEGETLSESE